MISIAFETHTGRKYMKVTRKQHKRKQYGKN